jgi:hypothetical protein
MPSRARWWIRLRLAPMRATLLGELARECSGWQDARIHASADWYPDPQDETQWRYWNGTTWTDDRAPRTSPVVNSELVAVSTTAVESRAVDTQPSTNPTLPELVTAARLEPPRHPLDEQVEVAGETHYVKGIKKVFSAARRPITNAGATLENVECILVPEPWNPYDVNAVAVMVGVHQVGHLPAELAVSYAKSLGRLAASGVLATGLARIWAKSDAGVVRARVTILIPEAEVFCR